jgi:hypothetical protein
MDTVQRAVEVFEKNLADAEEYVLILRRVYASHRHGFVCFGWRWCHKQEQKINDMDERIVMYRKALEGLSSGSYLPAIDALNHAIPLMSETPMEVAQRVARTPATLASIRNSPTAIRTWIVSLRDDLIELAEA